MGRGRAGLILPGILPRPEQHGRQTPEWTGDIILNAEISARRDTAISNGVGMQTQIYVERALNSEVWDVEGTRYIDSAAGIAVVNTGHCHPRVMAAVQKQAGSLTHTCHQVLPCGNYIHLAERRAGGLHPRDDSGR